MVRADYAVPFFLFYRTCVAAFIHYVVALLAYGKRCTVLCNLSWSFAYKPVSSVPSGETSFGYPDLIAGQSVVRTLNATIRTESGNAPANKCRPHARYLTNG